MEQNDTNHVVVVEPGSPVPPTVLQDMAQERTYKPFSWAKDFDDGGDDWDDAEQDLQACLKRKMPVDFVVEKIENNKDNKPVRFVLWLAASLAFLFIAHFIHEGFYFEVSDYTEYRIEHPSAYWTSLPAFFGYWVSMIAGMVAWWMAWWQWGHINALMTGLIVAIAGTWAMGMLDTVWFRYAGWTASSYGFMSLGDILPTEALQHLCFAMGISFAGVSMWSLEYKENVSRWLGYALGVVVILIGFIEMAVMV